MKEFTVRIVVTGSLAYDYIMDFPGNFKDHVLPDKAHMLTVSFLVDSMRRMRGGVAGNIAYSLALLGERPLVVASAGEDFGEYREWMERQGIDASGIVEIEDEFTASAFINTDKANNQIVAFYPGAMAQAKNLSLLDLGLGTDDLVVISPTDPEAMSRYADECRQLEVPFLFDPGKQTPRLEGDDILTGMTGASMLIGNDYEFAMMAQKTSRTEEELISATPLTVVTRGEQGSTIYTAEADGEEVEIPIAPVTDVVDPTGAGDAYIAGLVFGLARRFPLPVVGRIAALTAAYAVEQRGCQEHHFTPAEFAERYVSVFGPSPEVESLAEPVKR
ncbi:MAG TPA: carbohydrate kinase family protein [Actinomycetota bacterium]|jgi:adenosine kinase|nr:carbohydrate kinase family protein [Actinomycetota bacterium]